MELYIDHDNIYRPWYYIYTMVVPALQATGMPCGAYHGKALLLKVVMALKWLRPLNNCTALK